MTTMSTETILSAAPALSEADLARAQQELRDGHLLVVPTDTVYGIGADAANPEAVAAVLAAKGRGRQMPPPVLVASVEAIDSLCVDVPDAARTLARAFWPGGLTLILRARPDLGWDLGETGGTIGVRMPNQGALLRLLRDFGPMAVTSANLTGQPPWRRPSGISVHALAPTLTADPPRDPRPRRSWTSPTTHRAHCGWERSAWMT